MLLWVIFACLTGLVLLALLRPLATGSASNEARATFDATVYRDQLSEVESDRDRGLIGDADAEGARVEIARRLLAADAEARDGSKPPPHLPSKAVAVGLAVFLPLLALCLYLAYGSPRLPDQPLLARLEDPATGQTLDALVARVEARLREHPEEGEGWDVIAPVYMGQHRYADAAEAYRQAARLLGDTGSRLAGYGQALVLANDGVVTEDARQALERAAGLDQSLMQPKLLLTIAKEQDGQFAAAAEAWKALLASAPKDAPWRSMVEERLAMDQAHLTGATSAPAPRIAASPNGNGGPTQQDVAAAGGMSPGDRQAMIERMVQGLADRLAQNGDDLAGWLKLVRAYTVLDRKDDAAKALARAKTQFNGNAEALRELDSLASELGLKS